MIKQPVQEMIEQPVTHHIHRLVASLILFASTIFLTVYVPLRIIKWLHPSILPLPAYVFTEKKLGDQFKLALLQVLFTFHGNTTGSLFASQTN
jgi:E3 ubiquitin-protein ligase MARCH6